MSLRRTFRTEVAPTVYLVTEAVAVIDYHDDGEPCVSVEYRGHHYERSDGTVVNPRIWDALERYDSAYCAENIDPHKEASDAWADDLHEQAELENTKGVEAPMLSAGRDQREAMR